MTHILATGIQMLEHAEKPFGRSYWVVPDKLLAGCYPGLKDHYDAARSEPGKYVVEFVADFLLRKTSMDPWEYTLAPPALILFYMFLYEKEYLAQPPDAMMGFLSPLESHYLELSKEQFS